MQIVWQLIENAKENGKTSSDLLKDLSERITSAEKEASKNVSETIQSFIREKSILINHTKTFNMNELSNRDKYVTSLVRIIWLANTSNWNIKGFGSFLVKSLNVMKSWNCMQKTYDEYLKVINEKFTVPNQNLSLPEIAYLFTLNDLQSLLKDDLSYGSSFHTRGLDPPALDKDNYLPASFLDCFAVTSNATGNQKKILQFGDDDLMTPIHKQIKLFPCSNLKQYPQCKEYCMWHGKFASMKKESLQEFLTFMKYAIPQRKMQMQGNEYEKTLANKISTSLKDLQTMTSPVPIALFCYYNGKGMIGDRIEGLSERVCGDEFFPTPTDAGICQTKDMNIQDIFHMDQSYDTFHEPKLQRSVQKMKNGSLYSEYSIIILNEYSNVDRQSYPRGNNLPLKKIRLKIHSPMSLAKLNKGKDYDQATDVIELDWNKKDYILEITPTGHVSSDNVKGLDVKQRKCLTKNEIDKGSMFKVYNEDNCKYECYVKTASQLCQCTSWDFLTKNATCSECDVFGRTCFYKVMKSLANSKDSDICDHCITACDSIEYHANVKGVLRPISPRRQFLNMNPIIDEYTSMEKYTSDKQLFQILQSSLPQTTMTNRNAFIGRYRDMIIVTFKFRKPNIDYIDLRYSLMDKIAQFGGTFGILAEVTGSSLFGLISFFIFFFKVLFNCRQ